MPQAPSGPTLTLMVDVQYAWPDAADGPPDRPRTGRTSISSSSKPRSRSTTSPATRRLHREAPLRIAAGEWQNTRFEFADLMDVGLIDVAQPDVGPRRRPHRGPARVRMAAERGRLIVPHCWKTGIGIAASAHLAAVTPHCPYIEFLPARPLRLAPPEGAGRR